MNEHSQNSADNIHKYLQYIQYIKFKNCEIEEKKKDFLLFSTHFVDKNATFYADSQNARLFDNFTRIYYN
mgnify:CR=1 FL=1